MKLSPEFLEKLAGAAIAEGLADAVYTKVPTPIGTLLVATTEKGVCRVSFEDEREDRVLAEMALVLGPRVLASDKALRDVRDAFEAYFEEGPHTFDLPVDLSLVHSPFRKKVLQRLRKVRSGTVVTYGGLAEKAGNPRAARAAGTACATNPVPLIVPCHRVVPSSGGVGSYGLGGPRVKQLLLDLEGAKVAPR
ncbi:MAG: methylated-DNA-[protein]-cysteine S-methyltransferase [Actinomycetota bacterium]|jgi:methylated-DNA-[protein]-cysteine S-methyltransferase|nr:methylated-DNA-[protein]-cysteine S-methyltransferase [Actinomycetota bacterium]